MQPKPIQQTMLYSNDWAHGGRHGQNPIHRYGKNRAVQRTEKSFEQYLEESFQGEVVQDGDWFSSQVNAIMKENLQKLK